MSKDNRAKLLIRVETAVNSMDQLGDNGGNICPLALLHNDSAKNRSPTTETKIEILT